ncbi:MAG TPA: MEDS domain-containing protein [Vicinamibacterales bacterium]|nr:MEDS domain-containing protein [Vicinamibacterales bacterium]
MRSDPSFVHGQHAVTFYRRDAELFGTVGRFVGEGLTSGEPALLIATEPHALGILDDLRARGIDVDRDVARGDIVVIDAVEMLERITVDGEIHPERFARALTAAIEATVSGRPAKAALRAYGEMVDVLWQSGQQDEAIRLEILWNRCAGAHPVSVLCGYAADDFAGQSTGYEAVCRLHSHVVPPDAVAITAPGSNPTA